MKPGPYQPVVAYGVSKTLAEKAAWGFIKEKNPSFDLATVNPPMIYVRSILPCRLPANLQ